MVCKITVLSMSTLCIQWMSFLVYSINFITDKDLDIRLQWFFVSHKGVQNGKLHYKPQRNLQNIENHCSNIQTPERNFLRLITLCQYV